MGIYKTYKGAVIANGSTEGIYTGMSGVFITQGALTGRLLGGANEGWNPCNPADYLESIADFHARGLKLRKGDSYVEINGSVQYVEYPEYANIPNPDDSKRFILQAAAYQVETPEEKETLDAIDTIPQQVESLSDSEKPNNSEWKNGETLLWKNGNGEFLECNTGRYIGYDAKAGFHIYARTDKNVYQIGYAYRDDIKKPETPAEREERERLEAAYDLYLTGMEVSGNKAFDFDLFKKTRQDFYLAIVDKTGYRKKEDK